MYLLNTKLSLKDVGATGILHDEIFRLDFPVGNHGAGDQFVCVPEPAGLNRAPSK